MSTSTRLTLFVALLPLFAVLPACTDASSEPTAGASPEDDLAVAALCDGNNAAQRALAGVPHHTLVFVDRSSSAAGVQAAYGDTLEARLKGDLLTRGSHLGLYLVHDRTTGMAGHRLFSQQVEPPKRSDYDNEQRRNCNTYVNRVKANMMRAWQAAAPMLEAEVSDANKNGTDLWGVLEVSSSALLDAPEGALKRVYIFSDLLECMPGAGRRCFENRPPRSRQEAEAWGREDARRVQRDLRVDPHVLKEAHFMLLAGDHALREETRHAGYYWRALLEGLGVPARQVRVG